jgi:hypothetical protein
MTKKTKAPKGTEITTNRCYVIVSRESGKALSVHDRRTKARAERKVLGYNNVTIERLNTAYARGKFKDLIA